VEIKQKLLGSIFPAKLYFREDNYRTTPLNAALALILQKTKGLENEKTGQMRYSETLSSERPATGLPSAGERNARPVTPFPKRSVSGPWLFGVRLGPPDDGGPHFSS